METLQRHDEVTIEKVLTSEFRLFKDKNTYYVIAERMPRGIEQVFETPKSGITIGYIYDIYTDSYVIQAAENLSFKVFKKDAILIRRYDYVRKYPDLPKDLLTFTIKTESVPGQSTGSGGNRSIAATVNYATAGKSEETNRKNPGGLTKLNEKGEVVPNYQNITLYVICFIVIYFLLT
jgi:hypothetical protein